MLMIDKFKVLDIINDVLEGTEKFLINMKITPDNRIFVDIDGDNGVTIDDCIELSRAIENGLNREEEDFELNVSSAGADSPLKMPRQFRRHVGRDVSVVPFKIKGTKKEAPKEYTFAYEDVKTVKVIIRF